MERQRQEAVRGNGTVFAVNTDGTGFTSLHSFSYQRRRPSVFRPDSLGQHPVWDDCGRRQFGLGHGVRPHTNGTGFTTLYSFTNGTDGANPSGGLILSGSTLLGSAGAVGRGTVFAINTNGTGFSTLYSFTGVNNGGAARASLILSGNTLYGTTYRGGSSSNGTVFALGLIFVQFTANPTNGAAPLTVNFSSPGVDNYGNAITNWNWTFGDGSTSTAQNPSHTYTAAGSFLSHPRCGQQQWPAGFRIRALHHGVPAYHRRVQRQSNRRPGSTHRELHFGGR